MTDIAVPVQTVSLSPATVNVTPPKRGGIAAVARSAGLRAARTFTQAFLAVVTAGPVLNLNVSVFKAAGAAGFAAILTLAQRVLDETKIPTIPAG